MGRFGRCEVKPYRGVVALHVDGKPVPPMSFMVRDYFDPYYIQKHVACGHRICIFEPPKRWFVLSRGERESWDDSNLKRLIAMSANLYVIIALYFSPGDEWKEHNPDELCMYENGSVQGEKGIYPSFASTVFERDSCALLRKFIRFINTRDYTDRIIGYFPEAASTHEWNEFAGPAPADFSPAMHRAFRKFLKRKYRSVTNLRKAWNDEHVSFETAGVPSAEIRSRTHVGYFRDPSIDRRVMDYYECHSRTFIDRMTALAKTVKRETKGKAIVGFYHEPTLDSNPEGDYAWYRFIINPHIDFAAGPLAYEQRSPCLLYTSPSPRDLSTSRMPSSA